MPQYMSVEVSGEMIADLMADDGNFAREIWTTFAERLSMGLMADNLSDLLAGEENRDYARWVMKQFAETFERINDLHFNEASD